MLQIREGTVSLLCMHLFVWLWPAVPCGPKAIKDLVGQKQAVIRDEVEEADPLTFKSSWDIKKIDTWLQKLFPEAFEWLDVQYPLEQFDELHWHTGVTGTRAH